MSRSLIKLANRHVLTDEEFCNRFHRFFHDPEKRFGALSTSALIEIAKEMGLCTLAFTFANPEKIKKVLSEKPGIGILLITEKRRNKERLLIDYPHCRLVLGYHEDGRWNIWDYIGHPGHEEMEISLSDSELNEEMPHFIVLL